MEEKSFEEWYDAFVEFVRGFGYHGVIDEDTFREDWENGKDAYHVAEEFVKELKN